MGEIGNWVLAPLAVVLLAAVTLIFALYIGKWIDAQGNAVVGKPREKRRRETPDDGDASD